MRPTRAESDARRSAATRERLLDAAYRCLLELGYARTTTVEICRRADTPRGTLLHHFPSRDDVVLAAVGHVLDRRLSELEAAFARMARGRASGSPGGVPLEDAIDQLWTVVSGPTMHAWLELLVAARTDRELYTRFRQQMRAFDERVNAAYRTWFAAEGGDSASADVTVAFAFAVLNGLSLDYQYKAKSEVLAVLEAFKAVALQSLLAGKVG